ncbi:MAG: glycosyltransferase [Acidobacteria bacterium]|nr:glycosyltransferase [Acidobacteriota bacterium]
MSAPTVSVIVPVYNGGFGFERCLEALRALTEPPHEIIVVDDGSTDGSRSAAGKFGARVLATKGRSGPAVARNLGAKAASGDVLFFIDADVCVHPDSVERVRSGFVVPDPPDAIIGSYDDDPGDRDFLSQYKNLMHCYVHQSALEQASTFWSGCGAIRRATFLEFSGFDETYARPAIEDIELGYRLFQAGRTLRLDKDLRVKHLKRWTFWKLVKTDVFDRGIPWTELILRDRNMPNDLNLQISQRISVALAFLSVGVALLMTLYWRGYFLTPILALLLFAMGRFWLDGDGGAKGPKAFFGMTAGFGFLVGLSWYHHMLGIIPPVVLGYVLLFLKHRYQIDGTKQAKLLSGLFLIYAALAALFIVTYLPTNALLGGLLGILFVLLVLNNQFYLFLAQRRGRAFAIAAIPFHLLYHFYNGISFAAGLLRHVLRQAVRRPAASAEK